MNLLALTQHDGTRIAEVGFLLGAIAGALLALAAATPFGGRVGNLLGGVALAAGSVLLIIAARRLEPRADPLHLPLLGPTKRR